jgi:hypothetical protein
MRLEEYEIRGNIEKKLNYLEEEDFDREVYRDVCELLINYASYGNDIALLCERTFRVIRKQR